MKLRRHDFLLIVHLKINQSINRDDDVTDEQSENVSLVLIIRNKKFLITFQIQLSCFVKQKNNIILSTMIF